MKEAAWRRCRLFAGIEPDEAEALCRRLGAYEREYRAGQCVWLTGDTVTAAGLILCGCIRAESILPDGSRDLAAQQGPGGLVGDVLMIHGQPSPVDVIAAGDETRLLFLPRDALIRAPEDDVLRRLRLNLLEQIADKHRLLQRRIECLRAPTLRGKLLAYLRQCAADAGSATFLVSLDRQAMADHLACNRSALCRELSAMRRDRLIDYYGQTFRLTGDPAPSGK